jgi:hypothetical protein
LENNEEGMRCFDKAIKINKNSAEAHHNKGTFEQHKVILSVLFNVLTLLFLLILTFRKLL